MKYLLFAFLSLPLLACASKKSPSEPATEPKPQIANPASEYCVSLGGALEIRSSEAGETGWCTKDSHECDEWALFRGQCPEIGPAAPGAE